MRRKLSLAVLLALSAASSPSLALGLGEARVHSSLNAPLRATIPLSDSGDIDARSLQVTPGDAAAFERAGLIRDRRVGDIEYSIERQQEGLVLVLRSEHAMREPYLDLLLRVEWPEGRQHHQVTLLFDPPDYADMPALITTATNAVAPRRDSTPAQEPPTAQRSDASGNRDTSGDRHWVSSGDTLWSVARRLRPDNSISTHQMMLALVEANPEAFPSGNINDMRAGLPLNVPSREVIAKRSHGEADRQVVAQNQAWSMRGSATAVAGLANDASSSREASGGSATEPATNDTNPAYTDQAAPDPGGARRLTLLSDTELAEEGDMTVPLANGARLETAHVSELADPQAGDDNDEANVAETADGRDAGNDNASEADDERMLRLESQLLASQQALQEVRDERNSLQDELGELRDEFASLREQLAELTAARGGAEGQGTGGIAESRRAETGAAEAQPTPWWGALWQVARDNTLALGGAVIALLLALLFVRRRREHVDGPTFEQAYGVGATVVAAPRQSDTALGQPAAAVQAQASMDERDASVRASMPEAEVISEADIFIAYGRYGQARDLLETSLASEPDRNDLRFKLLKVLVETKDWNAASREADRLREGEGSEYQEEVERLMARRDDASRNGQKNAPSQTESRSQGEPEVFVAPKWYQPTPEPEHVESTEDESRTPDREAQADETEDLEAFPPTPQTASLRSSSNVIDYRPPSLDAEPAPRTDTLLQPSIEFAPADTAVSERDTAAKGARSPAEQAHDMARDLDESQWEVEEVAFEPLHLDNKGPADASPKSSLRLVVLARQLLDAGERSQAHELLLQVLDHGDATLCEEARDLLSQHNLD